MDEVISGIYKITCVPTQKIYIGQSRNIYKRWYNHSYALNVKRHRNSYLQRAWNKYGQDNFKFEIIDRCNINELDNKEKYYIQKFNSMNKDCGFNLDSGGQHPKLSHETIKKLKRISGKPVVQFDIYGNEVAKYRTIDEASKKCSINKSSIIECCKFKTRLAGQFQWRFNSKNVDCMMLTDCNHRNVLQFDKNGMFLKQYISVKEASNATGVSQSGIVCTCERKQSHAGGYIWRYITLDLSNYAYRHNSWESATIAQLDLKGRVVNIFNTMKDGAKSIAINYCNISDACRGLQKTAGGYLWRYVE